MNNKTIIILIVIVLALVGVRKLLQEKAQTHVTMEDQAGFVSILPASITAANVSRIDFVSGKAKTPAVSLAKKAGIWTLASSWNAPVNASAVKKYLKTLTNIQGDLRSTNTSQHATFELDEEKALHVQIFTDGAKPAFDLMVGGPPKGGYGKCFVRRAGEKEVYLVDKDLRSAIGVWGKAAPKHGFWLQKKFLSIAKKSVTKIKLEYPDHNLIFGREKKPQPAKAKDDKKPVAPTVPEYVWKLKQGGSGGAKFKADSVTGILDAVAALDVADVVDPAKRGEYGLKEPAYRFTATLEGGKKISFVGSRVRGTTDPYVEMARNAPATYRMSDTNFRKVFRPGTDFFSLKPPALVAAEILSLTYTRGKEIVRLTRKDKTAPWQLLAPTKTGFKLKEAVVKDAVKQLAKWKVEDYADLGPQVKYGFALPRCRLEVKTAKGTTTLYLGKEHPGLAASYIAQDSQKQILVIKDDDRKKIFPALGDLLDLTSLIDRSPGDVEGIEITRKGEKPFVLRVSKNSDGTVEKWSLIRDGKTVKADPVKVFELLNSLKSLKGEALLSENETAAAFAKGQVETIALLSPKGRVKITFGGSVGEGRGVRVSARTLPVRISKEAVSKVLAASKNYELPKPLAPVVPGAKHPKKVKETIKLPVQ